MTTADQASEAVDEDTAAARVATRLAAAGTAARRAPFTATPWTPGKWVETASARPCREGVHACRAADVAHWLAPTMSDKPALKGNGLDCSYIEMHSSYGHDAFLLENRDMSRMLWHFLDSTARLRGTKRA